METARMERVKSLFVGPQLPKTLKKIVERRGFTEAQFGDDKAWRLHSRAYSVLKGIRQTPAFYEIGSVLLAFLEAKVGPISGTAKDSGKTSSRKVKAAKRKKRNPHNYQNLATNLKRARPSIETRIADWKNAPKIGLGLESKLVPPPKARREEVVIDAHTASTERPGSFHALYVAGWSLSPEGE